MGGPRKIKSSFAGPSAGAPPEQPAASASKPARRRPAPKGAADPPPPAAPPPPAEAAPAEESPFLDALIDLLASRDLEVPSGLREAPPAAYAAQGVAAVQMMARLKDADLLERANRVAGWQGRQEERSRQAWESSPLIREVRRRGLPEPERPARVAGVAFSLKKPLAEWTDGELLGAVTEWAALGTSPRRG
jgi:hypothetical protein